VLAETLDVEICPQRPEGISVSYPRETMLRQNSSLNYCRAPLKGTARKWILYRDTTNWKTVII